MPRTQEPKYWESLPTVTKDPTVHLPSTWRDAIGKKLTNAKISRYQKQGRYGEDYKPEDKKQKRERLKRERRAAKQASIEEFC